MSSLDFGPLVLGGNVFGWTADRDASFAVLDAFVAAGGRSIDTADVYSSWVPDHSGGESERLIGEWLASRGHRDNVQIHTKVSMLSSRPGLSATNIAAAVDDSLGRLGTDHIDLYYAHRDDMDVDQSEYVAAFDTLVTAGKVRAVGASNFTAQRLQGALDLAHAHGLTPFTVTQDQWNLVERGVETTLLPTLQANGLAQLPYSGLASGFLTGKYRPGQSVESPRAGRLPRICARREPTHYCACWTKLPRRMQRRLPPSRWPGWAPDPPFRRPSPAPARSSNSRR